MLVLAVIAAFSLAWWFRYDTHCPDYATCVAYDRFTGKWIKPTKLSIAQSNIDLINKAKAIYYRESFDTDRALIEGYSVEEIINHLKTGKNFGE